MHPPFFHIDHKVDHLRDSDPHHRPKQRRNRPEALTFARFDRRFAPAPFVATHTPDLPHIVDVNNVIVALPHVRLVPPPAPSVRARFGRLLIRIGQRMILPRQALR